MAIYAEIGHKDASDGIQFIIRNTMTKEIIGWTWLNPDLTRTYSEEGNRGRVIGTDTNWDKAVYQALLRAI